MPERNSTANVLTQMKAFRELKEDYNAEVAECLTMKNLQRSGIDTSVSDAQGWEKINNTALHGNLDIQSEATLAEEKAATATATAHFGTNAPSLHAYHDDLTAEIDADHTDDVDDNEEESEHLTIDEMYGYDDPEDNLEAALDDILKIQENS